LLPKRSAEPLNKKPPAETGGLVVDRDLIRRGGAIKVKPDQVDHRQYRPFPLHRGIALELDLRLIQIAPRNL
jgi:hypothetical protein